MKKYIIFCLLSMSAIAQAAHSDADNPLHNPFKNSNNVCTISRQLIAKKSKKEKAGVATLSLCGACIVCPSVPIAAATFAAGAYTLKKMCTVWTLEDLHTRTYRR